MIYFIQEAGNDQAPIKIGYTGTSVKERLDTLQTSCPQKLSILCWVEGDSQDEAKEHKRWHEYRLQGEWFRAAPELMAYILTLGPETPWLKLVKIEPGLADLMRRARAIKDDGGPTFCANHRWYGCGKRGACDRCRGGLKPYLCRLVGWGAAKEELATYEAYDLAYQTLYDVLPACRNCGCM